MPIRNRTTIPGQRPRRRPAMAGTGWRRRPTRRPSTRQRLQRAARLHIDVKLHNGLRIVLEIGPAWLGLVISFMGAIWWPQLAPLIRPLMRLL